MLNADFYKSTNKNILFEICELSGTKPSQQNQESPRKHTHSRSKSGYVLQSLSYMQHQACLRICYKTGWLEVQCNTAGKEYGKADSRYITRDSFVINMEAFTAFVVGPMCFWAVAGMAHQKPWRHRLALLVSVCQLYGDVLYFATTGTEGRHLTQRHSSPRSTSSNRGLHMRQSRVLQLCRQNM